MNKETKEQMILESFDILKDSWEDKRGAIRRLLNNMFDINPQSFINMWLYILKHNSKNLFVSDSWGAYELTEQIVNDIYGRNAGNYNDEYDNENEEMMYKLVFDNKELYTLLFGKSSTIGEYTSFLLSHLIASNNTSKLLEVLKLIDNNSNKDETIGAILTEAIEHIEVDVPKQNIECLENFVAKISDKTDRAEAFTALLSLDD